MTQAALLRTVVREGSGDGPHLLITAGVHGDEFTSIAAVRELAGCVTSSLLRGRLTLVPIVNRAAFLLGQRTAEDHLDLARTCPGRDDGSITQRIAAELSRLIRSADFYIDLHTGSSTTSVHPMAGYMLHPKADIRNQQRAMARIFNLPIIWGTTATLEGRSLSVARDANVPAIYAEYLGSGACDPKGVAAYVEGCQNVMAWLGLLDRPLPDPKIRHWVEDNQPGSGHMQTQNPAPIAGFFEPAVRLGDEIRPGQRIGTIYDAVEDSPVEVLSQQKGIVLALRTFPRVAQGESLCVIMETSFEVRAENGNVRE
ncbi:MAG: succinylglutamate desuccinylase [Planctomycetes bacterium]|nr:succinylglutamate desuccinylase [Planctomycetota bacterium]